MDDYGHDEGSKVEVEVGELVLQMCIRLTKTRRLPI